MQLTGKHRDDIRCDDDPKGKYSGENIENKTKTKTSEQHPRSVDVIQAFQLQNSFLPKMRRISISVTVAQDFGTVSVLPS